jgi:hypothetical protein
LCIIIFDFFNKVSRDRAVDLKAEFFLCVPESEVIVSVKKEDESDCKEEYQTGPCGNEKMFFGGLGHGCKLERDVGGDLLELREVDLYLFDLILHVPKHIKCPIIGKISRNICLDLANHVVVVR